MLQRSGCRLRAKSSGGKGNEKGNGGDNYDAERMLFTLVRYLMRIVKMIMMLLILVIMMMMWPKLLLW